MFVFIVFLMRVGVVVEASTPQTDPQKVVSLRCAGLEPVVGGDCDDVANDRSHHKDDHGNDQDDAPHRQTHRVHRCAVLSASDNCCQKTHNTD